MISLDASFRMRMIIARIRMINARIRIRMIIFRCTSVSRDNLSETRDGRRESEAVIHGTSYDHTLVVVMTIIFSSRCVADSKRSARSDGFCFHRLDA